MNIREERRRLALTRIAGHMLREGLGDSSLRTLAMAAGTSDRMLLYYFSGKEDLITAALQEIAAQMAASLEELVPAGTVFEADALLGILGTAVQGDMLQPFMRLWLEVVCLAVRGEEPFRGVAGRIADGFLAWIKARLSVPDEAVAARLLALVDGVALLGSLGRQNVASLALSTEPR